MVGDDSSNFREGLLLWRILAWTWAQANFTFLYFCFSGRCSPMVYIGYFFDLYLMDVYSYVYSPGPGEKDVGVFNRSYRLKLWP